MGLDSDEELERQTLAELNRLVADHGLPMGELGYEIIDKDHEPVTLDMALALRLARRT